MKTENMKKQRKPKGYWKKEENIVAESEKVRNRYGGYFPSKETLVRDRYFSLSIYIFKVGFRKFRETYGFPLRPRVSVRKNLMDTIVEIKKIKREYGYELLPSSHKLQGSGDERLKKLEQDIRYNGGYHVIREKLGEPQLIRRNGSLDKPEKLAR